MSTASVAPAAANERERIRVALAEADADTHELLLVQACFGAGIGRENLAASGLPDIPEALKGEYPGAAWYRGEGEDIAFDVYVKFVVRALSLGARRALSVSAIARHIERTWGRSEMWRVLPPMAPPSFDTAMEVLARLERAGIVRRRNLPLTSYELTGERFAEA